MSFQEAELRLLPHSLNSLACWARVVASFNSCVYEAASSEGIVLYGDFLFRGRLVCVNFWAGRGQGMVVVPSHFDGTDPGGL